ncbi:MAG: glycosyltransferase 61 family protein [Methylocella sp.]
MQYSTFDEQAYLERYPDVALAVARNHFSSGYSHYIACGFRDGRVGTRLLKPEIIDIPFASREGSLFSPAFSTSPPQLFNGQVMPADLHHMYSNRWNQRRPETEIVCSILSDVVVDGQGLVFDSNGRLYQQTIHQSSAHDIDQAYSNVRSYLESDNRLAMTGVTLLCEKIGIANYGHWLVEMLPIVYLYYDRLEADWFLRAPLVANLAMNNVVRDSIELIGIKPSRIRWGTQGMPQRYERLAVVHGLSRHGFFYSPRAIECFESIAAKVPGRGRHKIWVSREKATRTLIDEPALCEILESQGWIIARLGDTPLRHQIELFKGAEVIAGVLGAGLTNLVFASSSTKILSFAPSQMPDIFYWMLSQFKRQSFSEVRCEQEYRGREAFNWDCKLLMTTENALVFINEILNTHYRVPPRGSMESQTASATPHIPDLHNGTHYHEFMALLSKKRETKRYLEIGVDEGVLMSHIYADLAVGVDPALRISANLAKNKQKTCLISATSDSFFADPSLVANLSGAPDLAFLDGFHTYEFLLRDFFNTEAISDPRSLIIMHDCLRSYRLGLRI